MTLRPYIYQAPSEKAALEQLERVTDTPPMPLKALTADIRRLNKQRSVFPSDTALLKALYLATAEISKKWTMPLRDWGKVLGELEIMYPDRLN